MVDNELKRYQRLLHLAYGDTRFTSAVTLSKVTHTTKRVSNKENPIYY